MHRRHEQGPELAAQFPVRIGFEEPRSFLLRPFVVENRFAGIPGGEQHFDVGGQLLRRHGEFRPFHASRQLDVSEQNVDMRVGEKLQRVLRRLRLRAAQPQALEHLHRHLAQLGLVLDDQDDPLAQVFGGHVQQIFFRPRRRGRCPRQIEFRGRSLSDPAVDADVAARLLDEAIDHAQAQTAALPHLLRRKERLERPFYDFGRHACSRVGDREQHVLSRRHFLVLLGVILIEQGIARLQRECSRALHRITRVHREIDQRPLQFSAIGECLPQIGSQQLLDADTRAQGSA